ncbi:MAG: zinc ribbon domain-containing protein [Actinomycetota bacterium]
MDTSRASLLRLLELQKVDSTIDRLEGRLRNLPEQAALEALEARLADLDRQIAERQAALGDANTRLKRLDHEVDTLGQKITAESNRLYSGVVKNAKELSDLSREVEALKRRKDLLEDNDLVVMEEREGIEKELVALTDERSALVAEVDQARAARDSTSGEVGVALGAAQTEHADRLPGVDPDLRALYDRIRANHNGVGIAAMVEGVCQGCHVRLPYQEAEAVRTATGIVRCDECQRLLVAL